MFDHAHIQMQSWLVTVHYNSPCEGTTLVAPKCNGHDRTVIGEQERQAKSSGLAAFFIYFTQLRMSVL